MRISFLIFTLIYYMGCISNPTFENRFGIGDEYSKNINTDLETYLSNKDNYYLELAKAYSIDGQTDRSIDYLKQSLGINYNNKVAHLKLAQLYFLNNRDHLSLLQLQKIKNEKQISQDKYDLSENEAHLINYSEANILIKSKAYNSARNHLNLISESSPYFDQAQWVLYYTYFTQNEFLKAQQALTKIVMTDENQVELVYQSALLAKNLKNQTDYENRINEAYMLDPHNLKIVNEIKNLEMSKNNYESAYAILKRYSDTHDFNFEISNEISNLSIKLSYYEEALTEIDKQWPWSNEHDVLTLKKAQIMFLMYDFNQSEFNFKALLDRPRFKNEAQYFLAQIYMIENRWDKAKPMVDQIETGSEFYSPAQINLAFFESSIGRSDKAISRLQAASKWKPNDLDIRFSLVNLLINHNNYSKASTELQSTLSDNIETNQIVLKKAIEHNLLRSPASQKSPNSQDKINSNQHE